MKSVPASSQIEARGLEMLDSLVVSSEKLGGARLDHRRIDVVAGEPGSRR
jgi:hypothetical protein